MSIATLADFLASLRQTVQFSKAGASFGAGGLWGSTALQSGTPAAMTALSNTTIGSVPVAGNAGFPALAPSTGSFYIDWAEWIAPLTYTRIIVLDRLFNAGVYTTSDNISLSSQPSYSSRVPGGTDFTGTQIWLEKINTVAGAATVTVTYTDQSGNAGASTSVSNGVTANQFTQMPLASGDSGVQKIESVVSSGGGAASTFNVVVARPLVMLHASVDNKVQTRFFAAGQKMPQIYSDSALMIAIQQDTGNPTICDVQLEIASG